MFLNNCCYILLIKLCIEFTGSMTLALSTCVLFISFMQSVNGAQFLDFSFLLLLFTATYAVFPTDIISLTSMRSSL